MLEQSIIFEEFYCIHWEVEIVKLWQRLEYNLNELRNISMEDTSKALMQFGADEVITRIILNMGQKFWRGGWGGGGGGDGETLPLIMTCAIWYSINNVLPPSG